MTTAPERSVELYSFTCLRCDHSWSQSYDVIRHQDCSGDVAETYLCRGVPCSAPASSTCPQCGGLRVKINPFSVPHPAS